VLVTAGARGSAYAFRPAGGKPPLTARVPVLKVQMFLLSIWSELRRICRTIALRILAKAELSRELDSFAVRWVNGEGVGGDGCYQ